MNIINNNKSNNNDTLIGNSNIHLTHYVTVFFHHTLLCAKLFFICHSKNRLVIIKAKPFNRWLVHENIDRGKVLDFKLNQIINLRGIIVGKLDSSNISRHSTNHPIDIINHKGFYYYEFAACHN